MFRHALSAFCGGRLNACGRQPSARVRDVAPRAWPALAFAAVALLAGSSAAGFAADNVAAVPPHGGSTSERPIGCSMKRVGRNGTPLAFAPRTAGD
jgi:hypothetical protein